KGDVPSLKRMELLQQQPQLPQQVVSEESAVKFSEPMRSTISKDGPVGPIKENGFNLGGPPLLKPAVGEESAVI
ncbi:hypothetical protein PJI21_29485, partial [Mycobacterium kansasii]